MKLISTNRDLEKNLKRLTCDYSRISFAVAWASANTEVFESITANKTKLKEVVIGTHFYQTDPLVLEIFVESKAVKFILQPKGVFHPKIFVFWTAEDWEILIGSANLTAGALTKNSEIMLLLSSADNSELSLKTETLGVIHRYWQDARTVNSTDASKYRTLWKKNQPVLRRLSGNYGNAEAEKAPVDSTVMSMTWNEFWDETRKDTVHDFDERCRLLRSIRSAFERVKTFDEMDVGLRKTIAGLPKASEPNAGWFGSMKGAGYFQQAINDNNPYISKALDCIPLSGLVTERHYRSFIAEFIEAFPNGRHGVGTASRLLAMKRPDYFVCIDSKNKDKLCEDFGIPKNSINYDSYWNDVIARIVDSPWWNSSKPENDDQATLWNGRAAMLDAIFYAP